MATNKSVLSLATFSFGLAIGFIFCYVLFSIVFQEREEAAPVILHNDPHGGHSDHHHGEPLPGNIMDFNQDSQQHHGNLRPP